MANETMHHKNSGVWGVKDGGSAQPVALQAKTHRCFACLVILVWHSGKLTWCAGIPIISDTIHVITLYPHRHSRDGAILWFGYTQLKTDFS
jgi:hypothetical protein